MAAGRGSRFGGMKQVAGLGPANESLFDFAVYDARRAGFDEVVFVVSEESRPAVEDHVAAGCGRHVPVSYVEQDTGGRAKPWGTGHAVLIARGAVDGPFGVVNADDFYGRRSFELLARELAADDPAHLLIGFRLRETLSPNGGVSRGVCEERDGQLVSISELHDVAASNGGVTCREGVSLTGDELVSVNLWGFRPSFGEVLETEFARFREEHDADADAEFLIGDGIGRLDAYGQPPVRVVPTPERFLGVTYREDVEGVQQTLAGLVADGEYPSPLWD
jgi:hypothetical protein